MRTINSPLRCFGSGDELYEAYHDDEWGRPVHGDQALLERVALEGFQAGLSWSLVLRRRENFRRAFLDFEPAKVAAFSVDDVNRLLTDEGIIRNRAKIEATIANARALLDLQAAGGSLDEIIWSHRPAQHNRPQTMAEIPSRSEEATALAKALKKLGFRFFGPTTAYATFQAIGLVNDHLTGCSAGDAIDAA